MRASLRVGLAVTVLAMVGRTDAQPLLTQRDGQGPVTVLVILGAPPRVGVPIRATVVLDTHTMALDGIVFEQAVVLRTPEGVNVAPTSVETATGSGHHRQAIVSLAPVTQPGTMRIVVKDVGGIAERNFAWELPPKP